MSWSEFLPDHTLKELRKARPKTDLAEEAYDQFEAALGCAIDIVQSGVVGNTDEFKFSVSLSGHANPDHKPTDDWADDMLSLSISQRPG